MLEHEPRYGEGRSFQKKACALVGLLLYSLALLLLSPIVHTLIIEPLFSEQDYKVAPSQHAPLMPRGGDDDTSDTGARIIKPGLSFVHNFHCLKDTPEMWAERRAIRDAHRQQYCNPGGLVPKTSGSTVPVVFIFWAAKRRLLNEQTFRMLALALNTAAKFNDRVLLLLFGKRSEMQLDVLPNVEIREVVEKKDPLFVALKMFNQTLYQHRSANSLEYELFCFQRWFAVQRLMEMKRLEHVFMADNDVLVLTNVTADVEQCYTGCDTAGAFVYSAYFTRQALQRFTRYILDFYSGDPEDRMDALLRKYRVISDMNLHREFNAATRMGDACTMIKVVSRQGMVPDFAFMGHFYSFFFDQQQAGLVSLHFDGYSPLLAPVLHFQGDRKKYLTRCAPIKTKQV